MPKDNFPYVVYNTKKITNCTTTTTIIKSKLKNKLNFILQQTKAKKSFFIYSFLKIRKNF